MLRSGPPRGKGRNENCIAVRKRRQTESKVTVAGRAGAAQRDAEVRDQTRYRIEDASGVTSWSVTFSDACAETISTSPRISTCSSPSALLSTPP